MSLCFSSPLGQIEFSAEVLDVFNRHRQTRLWSKEAGGQLFCKLEKERILVAHATEPRRGDKRSRFSFWPNRKREQRDIETLFSAGLHYIGDWHTHPQETPSPSSEDIEKIKAIFRESEHVLKGMLLVVVGKSNARGGVWCGVVSGNGVERLRLMAT